jgi:hypothetical protein
MEMARLGPIRASRQYLPVNDVQRPLVNVEGGFSDRFAERRMRMSGAADVF